MIETWQQYTCDGCGETEHFSDPNATKKQVRDFLRTTYEWRSFGKLDYCKTCVANGNARNRVSDMNS